jgi:hypothetical protein
VSDEAAGAAGVKKARTGLLHPLATYALRYGASERTVKRWRTMGSDEDPCPLDDPEAMLGWWSRHSPQKVPDGVNRAVIKARKAAGGAIAAAVEGELPLVSAPRAREAAKNESENPPGQNPGAATPIIVPEGRGLEAELVRLMDLAARLRVTADQPGQAKQYLDALSRMGAIQEKLRVEGEKAGRLVPKDLVEAALIDLHAPIAAGVRALYATMCEILGIPAGEAGKEKWDATCDALFKRFEEEVFA